MSSVEFSKVKDGHPVFRLSSGLRWFQVIYVHVVLAAVESSLKHLAHLKIHKGHMGDMCDMDAAGDQLSVLLGLPALRSLSLVDSGISQESLAHVGRCTKLTRLELQVRYTCTVWACVLLTVVAGLCGPTVGGIGHVHCKC
jgi:hypothetical protein